MWAGIDGGFQQRAARRPDNTAVIVVCSVNLILGGSLSQQVSIFVCSIHILKLIVFERFLVHSVNNLRFFGSASFFVSSISISRLVGLVIFLFHPFIW